MWVTALLPGRSPGGRAAQSLAPVAAHAPRVATLYRWRVGSRLYMTDAAQDGQLTYKAIFKTFATDGGATADNGAYRPVSEVMATFYHELGRPLVFYYRSAVEDFVVVTHLEMMDEHFQYDPVFALGLVSAFREFLRSYPSGAARDHIFHCMCKALQLDEQRLVDDAEAATQWATGKSEEEVLAAVTDAAGTDDASQPPVLQALRKCRQADGAYYYSREFGLGIVRLMLLCNVELTLEAAARWAEALRISTVKLQQDVELYSTSMEKLAQTELMYKEAEAREKARIAERLAEKAQQAEAKLKQEKSGASTAAAPAEKSPPES